MRIGIIQVVGHEDVCDLVEKEFDKEISTLEIKCMRIPSIDSAPMAARVLLEDGNCDFAVLPYKLGDDEKLGIDFSLGLSLAEFWLKKHIFKILIYPDENPEQIVRDAVNEIVMYNFNPGELEEKKESEEKREEDVTPFGLMGF